MAKGLYEGIPICPPNALRDVVNKIDLVVRANQNFTNDTMYFWFTDADDPSTLVSSKHNSKGRGLVGARMKELLYEQAKHYTARPKEIIKSGYEPKPDAPPAPKAPQEFRKVAVRANPPTRGTVPLKSVKDSSEAIKDEALKMLRELPSPNITFESHPMRHNPNKAEAMLAEIEALNPPPKKTRVSKANIVAQPEVLSMRKTHDRILCYFCKRERKVTVKPFKLGDTDAVAYKCKCTICGRYSIKYIRDNVVVTDKMANVLTRIKRKAPARTYLEMIKAKEHMGRLKDGFGYAYYVVPDKVSGIYVVVKVELATKKARVMRGASLDPIGYSEVVKYIAFKLRATLRVDGVRGATDDEEE